MEMEDLLRTHYGITAARCTGMDGYDSHNTRVQTADNQWVLKQYPPEAGLWPLLEAETELLVLLQKKGLAEFPLPQPDLQTRLLTPLPNGSSSHFG
jgi:Ser/Thr protein kinase RdoA (MazF antagonist)